MQRFRLAIAASLPIILIAASVLPAWAEILIDVSGNGTGSVNTSQANVTETSNITQSNTANVSNNVTQNANTGNNEANNNSGDASITTGNVSSQTAVENQVNQNTVTDTSSAPSVNTQIVGNGADSTNTVNANVSQTTTVNIGQTANVNNSISIDANSGDNQASGNGGSVSIFTGDVKVSGSITNTANNSLITVENDASEIDIKVAGNGADSINTANVVVNDEMLIYRNDFANIDNNVFADINTGGNIADDNNGDVTIYTGDAEFSFEINNAPVNTGGVIISCEDGTVPSPTPTPTPSPNPNPSPSPSSSPGPVIANNNPTPSSDSGIGGEVLAAMLPATGISSSVFWGMLVLYLTGMVMGAYLRFGKTKHLNFSGYSLLD